MYVFIYCLIGHLKIPVQVWEPSLCGLYGQMFCSWLSLYLPWGKGSNTVITHNAMSIQNLFGLKQYRSLSLCSPPIPFAQCWLQHYSWPCIIHHAAYKYWLPMTGSEVVTVPHWGWTQMQSHTQGMQENVNDNLVFGHVQNFIAQGNTPSNCVFFWIF